MRETLIKAGLVGFGYWGPNLARNISAHSGFVLKHIVDTDAKSRERASKQFPSAKISADFREVTVNSDVDLIVIATPVSSHFEVGESALKNGKHILVTKPVTSTSQQAEALIEIAEQKRLHFFSEHTFLFSPAVKKIAELINSQTLGQLLYFDSTRVNLGLFSPDSNVLWDLASHDLYILDYLVQKKPIGISASGLRPFDSHQEAIAYMTLYFENNFMAHINVNWMSPVKLRNVLIGGDKKMLVWNDLNPDEKIKIYDKGVDITTKEGLYQNLVKYRTGDIWTPQLAIEEPLKNEINYLYKCITVPQKPFNDGVSGMNVIRMLQAANVSLAKKGEVVAL